MKPGKLQRQIQLTMLVAVALALHVIESLLPPLPVPGAKIGLANVATLVCLRYMGFWPAVGVSAVRSILGSVITGKFWGLVLDEFRRCHGKRRRYGLSPSACCLSMLRWCGQAWWAE